MSPVRELRGLELLIYKIKATIQLHLGTSKSRRFIKCGPRVRLQEALTMQYIAQNTTIRVPRLLDVYTVDDIFHIDQECIHGPVLEDVWHSLSPEEQRSSMDQLKDCLDQLRVLRPPHIDFVQAVDGSGLIDGRIRVGVWGPFENHAAFHSFLGHDTLHNVPEKYPCIQGALSKVYRKHYRTVFSHGDLGPHNVLWKDGRIIVIDWERSGWFPEYWDYNRVHAARGWIMKDWWEMFKKTVSHRYDDDEVEFAIRYSEYFEMM